MAMCKSGIPIVRLALAKQKCVRSLLEVVNTPEKMVQYVEAHYGCQPQEYVIALGLNSRLSPLGVVEVGMGPMDQTMVDPKVLFSALLLMGAVTFTLFHNHPSGSPEPSQMDVNLTDVVNKGAKILGLRLLDHIVLGGESRWVSFVARGLLKHNQPNQ